MLQLRKGVYPYEYIDHWESLMKHHCLKKKLYSNLNINILQMQITCMQIEFVNILK